MIVLPNPEKDHCTFTVVIRTRWAGLQEVQLVMGIFVDDWSYYFL